MTRYQVHSMEDALVYYREQQKKAYESYQHTGIRRYAMDEFLDSIIVQALETALSKKDAVSSAQEKRSEMIEEFIRGELSADMYTKTDVEKILRTVAWW